MINTPFLQKFTGWACYSNGRESYYDIFLPECLEGEEYQ